MWFDEHNHPVKYEELSEAERKKAHRERCYKLVSLVHVRGDAYVYVALIGLAKRHPPGSSLWLLSTRRGDGETSGKYGPSARHAIVTIRSVAN